MRKEKKQLVQPKLSQEIYDILSSMSKQNNVSIKFICECYINEGVKNRKPILITNENNEET